MKAFVLTGPGGPASLVDLPLPDLAADAEGSLRVEIQQTYPLVDAPRALALGRTSDAAHAIVESASITLPAR